MSSVTYQRKRRPGCLTILLLLATVVFLVLWLGEKYGRNALHSLSGDVPALGQDAFPPLNEIWSEGTGTHKVVRIPISGILLLGESPGLFGSGGTTEMTRKAIRRATHDRDVRALILEIDSGGGGITASDILYQELLAFKAVDPQRKIVALFGDVAASGAYYLALAADRIMARPTSITGSIGVMIQSLNFRELAERYGVRDMTIKSGKNKDLLHPLGEDSDEKREILQHVVDAMHQRFTGLIAEHRPLSPEAVQPLADGRIFTAQQALEHQLIDEIGYWQDAVRVVRELLAVPDVKIYRYEMPFSLSNLLRGSAHLDPRMWLDNARTPRLLYQWQAN